MYAVTATVTYTQNGWNGMRQIPTFYLDENVQGIMSESHARKIARDIVDPFGDPDLTFHITAVKL